MRQQAAIDAERDVTADYEIHNTVLGSLPASFLEHDPLVKKDRRTILRDHQGKYPEWKYPNKLALKEPTKNTKDMQKAAKLTLPQYAGEICKFLERNDLTTKMAGTAWSWLLDVQEDLGNSLQSDPDAWYRADDILEQINEIASCAEGAFVFGLDLSVMMRLNVANRIDVAMGIRHLRVDPFKRETDDFISSDTYKLVEKEAKEKQNLTWARQGHFDGSRAGNRFSGQPSSKSSGGGYTKTNYGQRGKGDHHKPKGKGGGSPKHIAPRPDQHR